MKNLLVKNYKLKKNDEVMIMLGKDNGKTGKILDIDRKTGKVLVEGLNTFKRHVKSMQGVEGGIVNISKPVNISNVQIVCSKCKKTTRIGFKLNGDVEQSSRAARTKQRICKKCQEEI